MDNQHRKIKGYGELSEEEIALMNRIKAHGPELERLVLDIDAYLTKQALNAMSSDDLEAMSTGGLAVGDEAETTRIDRACPCLWLDEGKISLQKGLMFLTRAIAQPSFF